MNQDLVGSRLFLEGITPTHSNLAFALPSIGVNMAGMDFFIRPATGTGASDWVRIPNADIDVRLTRRMTRTIIRGGEGDISTMKALSLLSTMSEEFYPLTITSVFLRCSDQGNHLFTTRLKKEMLKSFFLLLSMRVLLRSSILNL